MNILVAFHGKAGSGKSTNSTLLKNYLTGFGYEVSNMRFAGPVYELHDLIQNYMAQFGYEKQIKHRALLQKVGTEIGRDLYGGTVWSDITTIAARKYLYGGPKRAVIIDDMRFPEEFDAVASLKEMCNVVRVSLQAPEEIRKVRADKWPEDTNHRSETSLDEFVIQGKFDAVVDTARTTDEAFFDVLKCLGPIDDNKHPVKMATEDLEYHLEAFNEGYRGWEEAWGCGANFKWTYNDKGRKELAIVDISPVALPSEDILKKAAEELPTIMEQAESLVGGMKNGPRDP